MLILTRRIGETIIINDDIKIMVLRADNGTVRLGFEAPKDVSIHREEIWNKIQEEKKENVSRIAQEICDAIIEPIIPTEIKQ